MFFNITSYTTYLNSTAANTVFLCHDNWDDWGRYACTFNLYFIDCNGRHHEIGPVKVGQTSMGVGRSALQADTARNKRRPIIPRSFDELDDKTFSLGQTDWYYENLKKVSAETGFPLREKVLSGLNDIAFDVSLYEKYKDFDVTKDALMRFLTPAQVLKQFNRIAHGGVRLTKYEFKFFPPNTNHRNAFEFKTTPESLPPTNIHVLIGRNGVGKTKILQRMAKALVSEVSTAETDGYFSFLQEDGSIHSTAETLERPFDQIVSVSFSAFDDDDLKPLKASNFKYIGLRYTSKSSDQRITKTPTALSSEFSRSVSKCRDKRKKHWHEALRMLESDPMFCQDQIASLADINDDQLLKKQARNTYRNLSSGHKIVLLTITRLVEVLEEKTLVLIDEPESHLHPPLLSAFIRALADLLFKRNGVAIIATHSPVVLQEVPASCVWCVRREDDLLTRERPRIETFGESVGTLTHEVFRLEVTRSGFYKLIENSVKSGSTYDSILDSFSHQMGSEARALVQALLMEQKDEQRDDLGEQS